jgi:hypothetical protein
MKRFGVAALALMAGAQLAATTLCGVAHAQAASCTSIYGKPQACDVAPKTRWGSPLPSPAPEPVQQPVQQPPADTPALLLECAGGGYDGNSYWHPGAIKIEVNGSEGRIWVPGEYLHGPVLSRSGWRQLEAVSANDTELWATFHIGGLERVTFKVSRLTGAIEFGSRFGTNFVGVCKPVTATAPLF